MFNMDIWLGGYFHTISSSGHGHEIHFHSCVLMMD